MSGGASVPDRIVEVLNSRALPLTRAELAMAMGMKREAIRKSIARMVSTKQLLVELDEQGVEYISTNPENPRLISPPHPKKPKKVAVKAAVPKPEPAPEPEPEPEPAPEKTPKPTMKAAAKQAHVSEEYLRGYNRGYYDAMQLSQKEAFTEGKRSVVRKIANMLNIDMEHLLR